MTARGCGTGRRRHLTNPTHLGCPTPDVGQLGDIPHLSVLYIEAPTAVAKGPCRVGKARPVLKPVPCKLNRLTRRVRLCPRPARQRFLVEEVHLWGPSS